MRQAVSLEDLNPKGLSWLLALARLRIEGCLWLKLGYESRRPFTAHKRGTLRLSTPADGLFKVRGEVLLAWLLPETWKLKKLKGETHWFLTDGLYTVADFFHGKPNYALSFTAVRESLANESRAGGLFLAKSWRSNGAVLDEGDLNHQAISFGRTQADRYLEYLPPLLKPASFANQSALDEIYFYASDRFAQAFYLSAIFNYFSCGPRQYSENAISRFPQRSKSDFEDVLQRLGELSSWSEALVKETESLSAGFYVGSEPMISHNEARSIIKHHAHAFAALVPGGLTTENLSSSAEVQRIMGAIAKTYVYWLPHQGTKQGEDRLATQQAWLTELFEEACALSTQSSQGYAAPIPVENVSPRGAEELCCEWMRHLGAVDAQVTQFVGDGGIDVASQKHIAQVKHYAGSVGAPEVFQFIGVASVDGRKPLFFTSGTYTQQAQVAASRAKLALFTYSAAAGTVHADNLEAEKLLRDGL